MSKVCNLCSIYKPLVDFGVESRRSDGRRACCRDCYNSYMLNYYHENSGVAKKRVSRYQNLKRFNGLRDRVIMRDQERCLHCGMDRRTHYKRWSKDLTIDHIDGNGRNSEMPNNELNNLATLCLSCHGRKDTLRRYKVAA